TPHSRVTRDVPLHRGTVMVHNEFLQRPSEPERRRGLVTSEQRRNRPRSKPRSLSKRRRSKRTRRVLHRTRRAHVLIPKQRLVSRQRPILFSHRRQYLTHPRSSTLRRITNQRPPRPAQILLRLDHNHIQHR